MTPANPATSKQIIIDTNALMAIAEFKLDLFAALQEACSFSYSIHVLEGTLKELEKIKIEQRGKFREAAALALQLVKAKKVKILPDTGNVDDVLVKYSQNGSLVLTQDVALKRRLQKPYLTIRQKKRIMMVA